MAIKQTRRSISVRGTTYDKLRQYGETHGRSMSDVVEELLATILDGEAKPAVVALPPPPPPRRVEPLERKSEARMRFNPPPVMKPRAPTTLANRVVRAVAPSPPPRPPVSKPVLPGRPAPTMVKVVRDEPADKEDYRAIRF